MKNRNLFHSIEFYAVEFKTLGKLLRYKRAIIVGFVLLFSWSFSNGQTIQYGKSVYDFVSNHLIQAEPKSTHTWLVSDKAQVYSYDVDVRVVNFPSNPNRSWLYYFSLQVNFTDHDEWSHGGIQYANAAEFANSNNQGVNWGGGSDWAGYGGIGRTNVPYTWEIGKWYRYRVWRLNKNKNGLWEWLFTILDYQTGNERQIGIVVTKSDWIKSANVWIETGYGVQCETDRATVQWRNPNFKSTSGGFVPSQGVATYNGTCSGANSTNQGLMSSSPLVWFQTTNSSRTVMPNQRLW